MHPPPSPFKSVEFVTMLLEITFFGMVSHFKKTLNYVHLKVAFAQIFMQTVAATKLTVI